jgi:hypothetical protein
MEDARHGTNIQYAIGRANSPPAGGGTGLRSLDYGGGVDRQAIVRAQRRRQATDALEFERARAEALRDQLETIVVELDGTATDEAIFAAMDPEQAAVVRTELYGEEPEPLGDEWALPAEEEADPVLDPAEREAEIVRLQAEIEGSIRRQQAFEAYLEALGRD